jgi:hypothetical protein
MIFFCFSAFFTEHISHLTEHSLEHHALGCLLKHSVMVRIFKFLAVVNVKFYGKCRRVGLRVR